MLDCSKLADFDRALTEARAKLMLEISGVSSLPDVSYHVSSYVAYDPEREIPEGEPYLLCANTTTLVDVILNRRQTDKLLVIKDGGLQAIVVTVEVTEERPLTGRAAIVAHETVG
jgi:hypothetical protein